MLSPSQLQLDVAAFLSGLENPVVNGSTVAMQNVTIITTQADENAGDALTFDLIMQALAGSTPRNGKFGLAVVVNRPEMVNTAPNSAVLLEDLTIILEVVEDMALNRAAATGTGVTLDDARNVVANLLHAWSHDGKHGLMYRKSDPIPEAALEPGKRGWQLTFESKAHAHTPPVRCARPVITDGGALMTITCVTSGAAIRYTLDGSAPSITSALYSAPVDVDALPTGTRVRAAAYKAGLRPSDTAEMGM
jgi:hypothetical protein